MAEVNHSSGKPPKLAINILSLSIPLKIREQLIGDLVEEFYDWQLENKGGFYAKCWFWKQCLLSTYEYLNKQQGGIMTFAMSIFVFAVITLLLMFLGGEMAMFVDLPLLVMVLLPALFFARTVSGKGAARQSLKLLFSEQLPPTAAQLKSSVKFWHSLGNISLLMASVFLLIGFASISDLLFSDAQNHAVVAGTKFASLALLYASIIKVICYVCENRINQHYGQE